MKDFLFGWTPQRWRKAIRQFFIGDQRLRTPYRKHQAATLLVEHLETRLVPTGSPVTFAQFVEQHAINQFQFTNNTTSGSLTTISGGSAVELVYSNIVGLPADLSDFQAATLTISITTTTASTLSNGVITQPFTSAEGTLSIIRATPAAEGFGARDNLLTVTFTANMAGSSGGASATMSGTSSVQFVSMTSDFLDFSATTERDLSLSFSSVTPNLSQGAGSFLSSFVAAATGTFDSNPPPTIAPSVISGTVYQDLNDDGTQDNGEPGISGVTLVLTGTEGTDDLGTVISLTTVTDSSGNYTFMAPPSGSGGYTITETQPSGFLQGTDEVNPTDGGTINQTPTQDTVSAIALPIYVDSTGYNFGELAPASISGSVFIENDDNAVQNTGEPSIPGVTITLTGTDDQSDVVSMTTTTNASGQYSFTSLRPSNGSGYTVTETQPSGVVDEKDNAGSPAGNTGTINIISAINIGVGTEGTNYNFAETGGQLSGIVYEDVNANSVYDAGTDNTIGSVTLVLTGTDIGGNSVTLTTTTNANGSYTFSNLRASNASGYTVTETQPSGYLNGADTAGTLSGNVGTINIDSSIVLTNSPSVSIGTNYNFGEVKPSSLAGSVFIENDNNAMQGTGEPAIPGVTITLTGSDAYGATVSMTTTTNASGQYSFTSLRPAGSSGYTLTETQPSGVVDEKDNPGSPLGNVGTINIISAIALGDNTSGTGYNFAETGGQLSGTVYEDENANSLFDTGDVGIVGVTVVLTGSDIGNHGVTLTTTTDASGNYTFSNLRASNSSGYTITETQPNGYLNGADTDGSLGGNVGTINIDSSIVLTNSPSISIGTNYNFGEVKPSSVAGAVFIESDDNGIQNAGEPGIPGVSILLTGTDAYGATVSLTTTTNASGQYSFTSLRPSGSGYTLTETQPSGVSAETDNAGSPAGTFNPSVLTVISGVPVYDNSGGICYNFAQTGAQLSGTVYEDVNANGTFDGIPPDTAISGVTLVLSGTDTANNPVTLTTTTGADGSYTFSNLRASNEAGYTITETQPSGYAEGEDAVGTLGGSVAVIDVTSDIVVSGGTNGTGYNFGEVNPASISGQVFNDSSNNDGLFDNGEQGISGVTLVLTGSDAFSNPVSLTVTTDANGLYTFSNLGPSNGNGYTITETQPAGYVQGTDTPGSPNDGTVSSQTTTQDVMSNVIVDVGDTRTGFNFAELSPITLSGAVFAETDDNAIQEAGEPSIPGVTIVLTGSDYTNTAITPITVVTNASGQYSFTSLRPSNGTGYTITETQPSGYDFEKENAGSAGGNVTVPLIISAIDVPTAGTDGITYNFAETGSQLSGTVYEDKNANGVYDGTPTDADISGVTLVLSGSDIAGNPVSLTTTTGADGSYTFADIRASGESGYTITETQPSGYLNGADTQGSLGGNIGTINITSGISVGTDVAGTNYNFGEVLPASLSGTVFDDSSNNDGIEDNGESGISGVTLVLTGTDAYGATVTLTQTTNASGQYTFTSLRPDNGSGYTLTETQPATYLQGKDTAGTESDGTVTSQTSSQDVVSDISVADDATLTSYNFAELKPDTLAGAVFAESDNDGIQEAGEPGIAGVTITLTGTDFTGATISLTTTTAADGSYTFTGLRPDNGSGYTVTETQPTGFNEGKDLAGSPTDGNTTVQDVISSVSITKGNVNLVEYNFAETGAQLSGTVYEDKNANGSYDGTPTDADISGVTLVLTGSDIAGNSISLTTSTAANGSYTFANLRASNTESGYTITETQPAGYLDAVDTQGTLGGNIGTINVDSGIIVASAATGTSYNFGEVLPASLTGVVFLDANDDGIPQAGETKLSGVTVVLSGTDAYSASFSQTQITNSSGQYTFTSLRPSIGTGYTITETQPAYLQGTDTPGNPSDGTVFSQTSSQDVITGVAVKDNDALNTFDFAELQPASISGTAFDDSSNNDGVEDNGESGISDVTLVLTGTNDQHTAISITTTTGSDGTYTFTSLRPSNGSGYTITETQPSAYLQGKDNVGSLSGTLTTQSPTKDIISTIVTNAGNSGTNYNFGELLPDSLTGFVYVDSNDSGSKQPGDPGIVGVTVVLSGSDFTGAAITPQTITTGSDGSYTFTSLLPSNGSGYTITETQPTGFGEGTDSPGSPAGNVTTQDKTTSIVVPDGNTNGIGFNFGELGASVAGTVFFDDNNDGFQENGEPGIPGVTVTLTGSDVNGVSVSLTTTTDANGNYTFSNLRASSTAGYTLTETQPAGVLEGQDNAGTFGGDTNTQDVISRIRVPAGANGVMYTFAELPTAEISGTVFNDSSNDDGVEDNGELGIPGVTLVLTGTDGTAFGAKAVSQTVTTASDGTYTFTSLLPSNGSGYTITETQPSGYLQGKDTVGTFGGNPASQTTTKDVETGIVTGESGGSGTGYNFGELSPAAITGFVYVDVNEDGTKDDNEPGIMGVTVVLSGTDFSNLAVSETVTTGSDGSYTFSNLRPDNGSGYTITETQPAGYQEGLDQVGSLGGTLPEQDVIAAIPVSAGNDGTNYLFGEKGASSVSGTVYVDQNDNDVLDSGEPGIGGVTVEILSSTGQPVATTTTANNGTYIFQGLPAGTYTVVETTPSGYGISTPTTIANVSVPTEGAVTGENFGNTLSCISGVVYVDVNNNDTRDAGEPAIPGTTITLTGTDVNGVAVNRTTSTALNGTFQFTNLLAGSYTLTETQPTGFGQGKDAPGSPVDGTVALQNSSEDVVSGITVAAGVKDVGYQFGEIGTVLAGTVFVDQNSNAVLNTGEPGLGGVKLSLINSSGNVVATTTSGPDGTYDFAGLTPGTYSVAELPPNGYGTSTPIELTPLTVPVAGLSGENFGLTLASLSGFAYVDANNNGIKDATELGIPGVTVTLTGTDANGNPVNENTTTAGDGSYTFTGLVGGTYTVTETQPAGFNEGKTTAGKISSVTVGSAATDVISSIALGGGQSGISYNFGEIDPTGKTFISGTEFIDTNSNGVLNPGEVGQGGVTIKLTNSAGASVATTTTAANGVYVFPSLTPGTYTITETPPAGFDTTSATSFVKVVVPAAGLAGKNFGIVNGSLSGTVYVDSNHNGVLNTGEPGIPDVIVTLSGPVHETTTTAPNGTYTFTGLTAGAYTVTETQPLGYSQGTNTAGTAHGTVAGDVISAINLTKGVNATGYNFGELTGGLSGTVYVDANDNGVRDSGEPGIPGVVVEISGPVTEYTTTAFDGSFHFTNLPAGTYTLTETQPSGYAQGTDAPGSPHDGTVTTQNGTQDVVSSINLTAGNVATGYYFGEIGTVIAGTVYLDANDDSTLDSGDSGIGGVTVSLLNSQDDVIATTTTGKDGSYVFNVAPGSYTVQATQPTGYGSSQNPANDIPVTVGSSSVLGENFGKTLGSLSGTVYADDNMDGSQDDGEFGIPGDAVTLTGTDVNGNPVSLSTVTDANGNYTFTGLLAAGPGGYTVTAAVPPGDYSGLPGNVGTSGSATDTATQIGGVPLAAGVNATGYKFGAIPPADPFGFVYLDVNDNGIKDPGEPGIAGVTVTISGTAFAGTPLARPLVASDDPSATPLVRVTNASGFYQFLTLPPGVYSITETQPANYRDGSLQDADPLNPPARLPVNTSVPNVFSNIQLVTGDARGPFNFGELASDSLSGMVFLDKNNAGKFATGDPLEPGVIVTLTGFNFAGTYVTLFATTNASGVYTFANLAPSGAAGYTLSITVPSGLAMGKAFVGSAGGTVKTSNSSVTVVLGENAGELNGVNYDFSLLPAGKKQLIGT